MFVENTHGITGQSFWQENMNYLMAPSRLFPFYTSWVKRNEYVWKGRNSGYAIDMNGVLPRFLCQTLARGVAKSLFSEGVSFVQESPAGDYKAVRRWANRNGLLKTVRKAFLFAEEGGAALLKLGRERGKLTLSAVPFDKFFVSVDGGGRVVSARLYIDILFSSDKGDGGAAYGICEERYFDGGGCPVSTYRVYRRENTINILQDPDPSALHDIPFNELPDALKDDIAKNYPKIISGERIGKKTALPFHNHLGLAIVKFEDYINSFRELPFGECLPSLLWRQSLMYDWLGQWETHEMKASKARVLLANGLINRDAYNQAEDYFNQCVLVNSGQYNESPAQPVQFELRAEQVRAFRQYLIEDCAFILQTSASMLASFVNGGTRALTESEILSEATLGDTFVKFHQGLAAEAVDEILRVVCRYYGIGACSVRFKSNSRATRAFMGRTYVDLMDKGYILPKTFVEDMMNLTGEDEENLTAIIEMQQVMKARREYNAVTGLQRAAADTEKPDPAEISAQDKVYSGEKTTWKQTAARKGNDHRVEEETKRL
jgi:hypothetical protein